MPGTLAVWVSSTLMPGTLAVWVSSPFTIVTLPIDNADKTATVIIPLIILISLIFGN